MYPAQDISQQNCHITKISQKVFLTVILELKDI